MRGIKKIITIETVGDNKNSYEFWISKTPEERVEAVETIRQHHYAMLGYKTPPRIKNIIRFI